MRACSRHGGWGGGALVGFLLLGLATTALAADPIPGGTFELGAAGGASISHNVNRKIAFDTVYGWDAFPHLGWVLTSEYGQPLLRGNLEILIEPTYIHVDASTQNVDLYGLAGYFRWLFTGNGTVRPYLEAGGGAVYGQTRLRETTCDYNFLLVPGAGLEMFFTENAAVRLGYRFQHVSNGGRCTPNLGLNSSLVLVGLDYYFR